MRCKFMFISSNFTNEKIYCSAVVNKILTTWSENKSIKISQRDSVIVEPEEKYIDFGIRILLLKT